MRSRFLLFLMTTLGLACGQVALGQSSTFKPFILGAGQSLAVGDVALIMQSDGNLVVYRNNGQALWAASFSKSLDGQPVWGRSCAICYANFQADGNLVLYGPTGAYWSAGSFGNTSPSLILSTAPPHLQINAGTGSMVYPIQTGPFTPFTLRAGETVSRNGILLAMQPDGNLVAYRGNGVVWAASHSPSLDGKNVYGRDCANCVAAFQPDGNLVLYAPSGPYWSSKSHGNAGATLSLTNSEPFLMITATSGSIVFPPPPPYPTLPGEFEAPIILTIASLFPTTGNYGPGSQDYWKFGNAEGSEYYWRFGNGPGSQYFWNYGGNRAGSLYYWNYGTGVGSKYYWTYGFNAGSKYYWTYGFGVGGRSYWRFGI